MLPSMPILFSRESQDAFGNKIEPSTSFFHRNPLPKPIINPKPPPQKTDEVSMSIQNETKAKPNVKKKPNTLADNALEIALVKSYYTKVQSRFASYPTVPTNKFVQFREILKTFDPSKETPVDLYRKIENLFGEEHKDIVEEFLLFLKPGQAVEIGRFMDYVMLLKITGFIELLRKTFARKPTVLRKVLRALTSSINSGNSTEMKTRVLPHMRSNPRLIEMYKSLFPDERPPDSAYETGVEVLNESFLTNDNGQETWEFEEKDTKRRPEAKEGLDTMYLHGRVFLQHGRMLRTARVTFPYSKEPYRVHARRLAPTHSHLSPSDLDEDRKSKRSKITSKIPAKRPRKQHIKSPTKNVKDVNDNTKHKEVLNSPKVKRRKPKSKDKKEDKPELKDKRKEKQDKGNSKKEEVKAKIETPVLIKKEVKNNTWTRDEDKTMLQVIKGEADSKQVFIKIKEMLPHKSPTEIKERFYHVMNLLQQMAVGQVT